MSSAVVEWAVARILLWGGLISVSLMLIGLAAYAVQDRPHAWESARIVQNRQAGRAADVFSSLTDVGRGLRRWPPDGLATAELGLLCLLATPVAGVAVATVYFWRERDRRFVMIGTLLLAMLLVSLALVGGV